MIAIDESWTIRWFESKLFADHRNRLRSPLLPWSRRNRYRSVVILSTQIEESPIRPTARQASKLANDCRSVKRARLSEIAGSVNPSRLSCGGFGRVSRKGARISITKFFRSLWSIRNNVHRNLCVTLLIGESLFLFGVDETRNKVTEFILLQVTNHEIWHVSGRLYRDCGRVTLFLLGRLLLDVHGRISIVLYARAGFRAAGIVPINKILHNFVR